MIKSKLQFYISLVLVVVILAVFYHQAASQPLLQNIKGTIVDEASQAPVIGANIVLLYTDPIIGGTSDLDGHFKIEGVPVGRYEIRISYLGYETRILPNVMVSAGKECIINVSILESLVNLEEVEILPEEQKEEALNEFSLVSTRTFSVEETARYAGTFDDPSRMAETFAGVRGGEDDEANEIIIRGNSPRGLLWRLEGVEIPSPNHFTDEGASSGAVSILSHNMLSNSDFSTGAFPAEYGNAISGVFDINMRKGNNEQREYAFTASVLGLDAAMEGPFSRNGRSAYLVNYRYSTLALLNKIGLEVVGDANPVFQDLSFKLNFPTNKSGSFSVFGIGGLSNTKEQSSVILEDGTEEINWVDDFTSNMGVLGVNHKAVLGKKTYLKSTISLAATYNAYEFEFRNDFDGYVLEDREQFKNYYARGAVTLNHKFNARHLLRSGLIYTHLAYDLAASALDFQSGNLVSTVAEKDQSYVFQGFANHRYRINEKLVLQAGLHFMYFGLNGKLALEPRAGIKWQVHPNHSLSAGFGIHSRREGLATYVATASMPDGSLYQPNRNLGLTKARHYVLGYDYQISPDLHFKTELYYQDLFDVPITTDSSGFGSAVNFDGGYVNVPLVNEGSGENYGIELTLEKFFSRNYFFHINGSLFESKYTAGDGIKRDTRYSSKFLGNLRAGKEFRVGKQKDDYITFSVTAIWAGGKRITPIDLEQSINLGYEVRYEDRINTQKMPNYWRGDLSLSFTRNKKKTTMEWKIDIQNFTNRLNVVNIYYSNRDQSIYQDYRGSLIPVLSYKVRF